MKTEKKSKKLTPQDYLKEAYTHYQNLAPNFTASGNNGYWILGCILDSIIDFLNLAAAEEIVSYEDGRKFLNSAASTYIASKKQGEWYDDWGWWGNSTAKVFSPKYSALFGNDKILHENFKLICTQTFNFMKTGTPPYHAMDHNGYTGTMQAYNYAKEMATKCLGQGWEKIVNGAEPLWNIGCWQSPMTPTTYNPLQLTLGPFQDSVVNGLFYIFTQRTLNQKGLGTQQDVEDMTTFYRNWMNQPLKTDQQLFNVLDPVSGLFRERVSIYKNGNSVNGYNANLAWTGDQGLMLIALTHLFYKQSGPQQQATLNFIIFTINGVYNYALGDIDKEHTDVIMPWCNIGYAKSQQPGPPPGCDFGDYFSGTGIFMRGLLEASSIPAVKQLIGRPEIQQKLNNTLSALLDGTKYIDFIFMNSVVPTGNHLWFDDFNKMSTLTVASQLLK